MRCVGILSDKNFFVSIRILFYSICSLINWSSIKNKQTIESIKISYEFWSTIDLYQIYLIFIYFMDLTAWRKYRRSVYSHIFYSLLLLFEIRYDRKSLWYLMCAQLYAVFIIGFYSHIRAHQLTWNFEHTITCRTGSMTIRVYV